MLVGVKELPDCSVIEIQILLQGDRPCDGFYQRITPGEIIECDDPVDPVDVIRIVLPITAFAVVFSLVTGAFIVWK